MVKIEIALCPALPHLCCLFMCLFCLYLFMYLTKAAVWFLMAFCGSQLAAFCCFEFGVSASKTCRGVTCFNDLRSVLWGKISGYEVFTWDFKYAILKMPLVENLLSPHTVLFFNFHFFKFCQYVISEIIRDLISLNFAWSIILVVMDTLLHPLWWVGLFK